MRQNFGNLTDVGQHSSGSACCDYCPLGCKSMEFWLDQCQYFSLLVTLIFCPEDGNGIFILDYGIADA